MKLNQRKQTVAITLVALLVLCAAPALISQHAFAQKGRPILILTKNGEVVVKIIGPKGATDVHVVWGGPGIPEGGGYGYWTKNRQEMPKSRFQFGSDINDIHFSPTGRVPRLPPVPAPPEANDVEIGWEEDGRITEAWWTRDGQQLAAIPVSGDAQELSVQFNRQRGQSTQSTATTQLVGLVYDKESRSGEQATMSLTTNPKKYENTPGLGVIEMQAPLRQDASGQATLEGTVVDLGDGRQQSATGPLTIQIASNTASIPVKLTSNGNTNPMAQGSVPISTSAAKTMTTNTGKPSDFTTPPVVLNTSVIHGPLSGDGNATRITLDNQPAKIIAESRRNAYFDLPPNTPVGSHTAVVQDGGRSAQFPIVNMALVMQADQTQLQRGQSTNYSATVRIGPLPNEIWQHGGIPSDQPGVVNLRIENGSRDVVSIMPSQNEVVTRTLHQQDFQNGQFTLTGRIQSKQSGGFVLNGLAKASFAPIHGQDIRTSTSFDRASVVSVLTPVSCVVSNINALKKWLNVPPPGPATKYIGQYHNWTPDVANDFEVDISHGGEEVEPEDGDTFGEGGKQQVTRYLFKGKDIPHCSYVTVHIPEIPTGARVSWTKNGDVLGGTASIPSQTVFQPANGTEAFKPPEGANDFHIESKDEIAGFWAKDGVKISLSDNPKDDYRYKVDVSGIDSNFSQYWIHFVKGTLQDRYKWWWTKDKKQIGKAGEG